MRSTALVLSCILVAVFLVAALAPRVCSQGESPSRISNLTPGHERLELRVPVRLIELHRPPADWHKPKREIPFTPNKPLELDGAPSDRAAAERALSRALDYMLRQAHRTGGWKYSKSQVRESESSPYRDSMKRSAGRTAGRLVTTSLVSLATHRAALALGRPVASETRRARDLVASAALRVKPWKMSKTSYTGWATVFAIDFLVETHAASDAAGRARVEKSVRHLVDVLLESQHDGSVADQVRSRRSAVPATAGVVELGGNVLIEAGGRPRILARSELRRTPLQPGDLIVAVAGRPVATWHDYYTATQALKPGPIIFTVDRPEKQLGRTRSPQGFVPRDGGWSYNNTSSASMLTAHVLYALHRASSIAIHAPRDDALRGCAALEVMRFRDTEHDAIGYRYSNNLEKCEGIQGTAARNPLAELALLPYGRSKPADIDAALETFLAHRGQLDKLVSTWAWHEPKVFFIAPYFYLYGHWFSVEAAAHAQDPKLRRRTLQKVQDVLLKVQHRDGTWTDQEAFGRLIGTALGSLAMAGVLKQTSGD